MEKPLVIENLQIDYDSFRAVDGVSLEIQAGEIFGLLGPNGAGKTSTLSAIEGLVTPTSGTIMVAGFNAAQQPSQARQAMGVSLQKTSFQSELTIDEIIELYAGLYALNLDKVKADEILTDMGLGREKGKLFKELSGGQQQRVSLILALIHNPILLLLDEPTTGLDPQSRRQLWERIEAARQTGRSVLLTTHSMEEAESVCDRIAIIDHGRIVSSGTPKELIEKHAKDPDIIKLSRGDRVTLEDVFIGLTGRTVR